VKRLGRTVGRTVFGMDADGYDMARPDYPAGIFDQLSRRAGTLHALSGFEIGPGTGIATRALLARGVAALVGYEPDKALAARVVERIDDPRLRICTSSFEGNRAQTASFDFGVAATSFHWLAADIAYPEVRRLLKPGGQWGMWWNVYRTNSDLHPFWQSLRREVADMAQGPQENEQGHFALDRDARLADLRHAGFSDCEPIHIQRAMNWTGGQLRALYGSFSFVRALDAPARERLLDRIQDIARTEFGDDVPNPILTVGYFAASPGS
jgi:SAM-dependent methyltransferase